MPTKEKPFKDVCCGAYCEEAGCCPFEKQKELFPDEIQEQLSGDGWIDFQMRGETDPFDTRKPYEKIVVPDWVKERRNRDTDSNLD